MNTGKGSSLKRRKSKRVTFSESKKVKFSETHYQAKDSSLLFNLNHSVEIPTGSKNQPSVTFQILVKIVINIIHNH